MRSFARALLPLAVVAALGVAPVPGAHSVEVTDPEPNHSSATAINDDGWIVGSATSSDGPYTQHPVLWKPRTHEIVDLGTMGGYDWGGASAINDRGQIVGSFGTTDDGLAFLRRPSGQMVDIGTLGGASATANDINNSGQIVGWSLTASGARRPFLWRPLNGQMINLGTLGDRTHSMAVAITKDSTVLGMAWSPRAHGTKWHAWLWRPGTDHLIRLEKHGLPLSTRPEDINDRGQVVGCTWPDDTPRDAVLWRPGTEKATILEGLAGNTCAWALSNATDVTGWSVNTNGDTRAFRWQPPSGPMEGLGTLSGPSFGSGVSGTGVIVGSFGESTTSHAFVWDPKSSHMVDLGLLVSTCQASNLTTGSEVSADLQSVIDAATSGDTVQVSGVCQGSFTIFDKSLTLQGAVSPAAPTATLDGMGASTALRVGGDGTEVELKDLLITHGWNKSQGGGVQNTDVSLLLTGSTVIAANHADQGGGIFNSRGTVSLVDAATIADNGAGSGGGIYSYDGAVKLSGSSSISDNLGGGIYSYRNVVELYDTASVTGNFSHGAGGGIFKVFGPIRLTDSSKVADNRATYRGGGIDVWGRLAMSGTSTVTANSAAEGGGINIGGENSNWGQVTMQESSTVTGNTADLGAGIYSNTAVILQNLASITLNTAQVNGGGVFNDGGTVTLLDSATIVDNIPNNCADCAIAAR